MGESTERILDGNGLRIAIVYSEYNGSIVNELLRGAKEGLEKCNVLEKDILCASVPGAFEIPLIIKRLCKYNVNIQSRIYCSRIYHQKSIKSRYDINRM